jgi:hypothetical protein
MEVNEVRLREQGFAHFRNFPWNFNRKLRIAFSDRAMWHADRRWIKSALEEQVESGLFVFYYLEPPKSGEICMQMLETLELMHLLPQIRLVKPQAP